MTTARLETPSRLDIRTLKESARGRWPQVLASLGIDVPDNPKKHGPCPTCGGKDRFRFDDEEGRGTWFCNQCDPKAGDGFDLVQKVHCCDFKAAAELVHDALGGPSLALHQPHTNGSKTMNGTLEKPVTIRTTPPDGLMGKTLFPYTDELGQPCFYVQRIERPDGSKSFPQWGPSADGDGWQANMRHVQEPRPLYRLPDLLADPEGVIIFHEGEKAVEAHIAAGLPGIPTTSSQGAGKAKYTDFSPLAGRCLVICPDNDEPGEQHAEDVAARAHAAGAVSVRTLRLPDLAPKGDVVEWLAAGGNVETFAALVETAEEVRSEKTERQSGSSAMIASTPTFPIEALPPILRRYVVEQAAALPVPVDLIAIPALVAAGAAIGRTREIQLKAGWLESASLYAAIVSTTGSLKTPALSHSAEPLRRRQRRHLDEYKKAVQQYEADLATHSKALTAYKNDRAFECPPKPSPPIFKRTWTADTTVEKLAGILAENHRGVAIIRDELTGWARSMNQYRGGKGADKQFYLSAWSGAPIVVDRQGKESLSVSQPFLSVVGCMTPDGLASLNDEEDGQDGFIERLLFAYPEPVSVRWTDATVSPLTQDAYHDLFESLFSLSMVTDTLSGEKRPLTLNLTPEARALFVQWHDTHCREAEESATPSLQGAFSKLKGYCARLALIHAVCLNPATRLVGVESVSAASDLIDYFVAHFAKIAPLLIRRNVSEEARCETDIKRILAGGKIETKRDLQRRLPRYPAKIFNHVFSALRDAEQLEEVEKPGSRRNRPGYRLTE